LDIALIILVPVVAGIAAAIFLIAVLVRRRR
jgi:hypothetical protein